MSPRNGFEANGGNGATARKTTDGQRPAPRLAIKPANRAQAKSAVSVERIGRLTEAELAELSPASQRGLTSGAFAKRGGEAKPDWSALKHPTPLPPPPAAGHVALPSAVQPNYNTLPATPERAELHISEISLEMANPFVGSSLLPPPPKKRPWLKPSLIALGCTALMGAGYAGAVYHVERTAIAKLAGWTGTKLATTPAATAPASVTREVAPPAAPVVAPVEEIHAPAAPAAESPITDEATVEQALTSTSTAAAGPAELPTVKVKASGRAARGRRGASRDVRVSAKVIIDEPTAAASDKHSARAEPDLTEAALSAPTTDAAPTTKVTERPAAPAPENLPRELSRDQVQNGLEGVRSGLESCAAGEHGRMIANVTISGAGRVTYATIEGAFAGTPQGSCMARALRGAQFPQVASPQLRVRYPFAL